jgi:hypothetical protein
VGVQALPTRFGPVIRQAAAFSPRRVGVRGRNSDVKGRESNGVAGHTEDRH